MSRRPFSRLAFPLVLATACLPVALSAPASAQQKPILPDAKVETLKVPPLPLARVEVPGGKALDLNIGLGSGAFRLPADPDGVIWTITDRGPNIDCGKPKAITGRSTKEICQGDEDGKIFPVPDFAPSIYKLQVSPDGTVKVLETIPLKGRSGKPISGRPNPIHTVTETAYGVDGRKLSADPSGLDTEAVVRLPDGTFWVSEEYAPSLVEVAPDGTIRRRLVPDGMDLAGADYPVEATLPAILALREPNRGFESLAISPDGAFLYAMVQSPLANPDEDAFEASPLTRLIKVDRATGRMVAEYAYQEDPPASFSADNATKDRDQEDVKVSEMVSVGPDHLLVLERIDKSTKFYLVDLTGAATIPATYDQIATTPTLEQLDPGRYAAAGIVPLAKTLLLNSDFMTDMPAKIESVAVMSDHEVVIITDSDFGITGTPTEMRRITLPPGTLQ